MEDYMVLIDTASFGVNSKYIKGLGVSIPFWVNKNDFVNYAKNVIIDNCNDFIQALLNRVIYLSYEYTRKGRICKVPASTFEKLYLNHSNYIQRVLQPAYHNFYSTYYGADFAGEVLARKRKHWVEYDVHSLSMKKINFYALNAFVPMRKYYEHSIGGYYCILNTNKMIQKGIVRRLDLPWLVR